MEKCTPIMGDQHWAAFTWADGGPETLRNLDPPVTLRFQMYQAELYGIAFE